MRNLNDQIPWSVVIMMTTDPTPELATRFLQMGADGYVRKPFDTGYVITLWEMARRERALLRVEDRLEERTRELWKSESRYCQLFDKMLNGFALHEILCDVEGKPFDYRFLDVNPAFEKIVGIAKEQLIGKTVLEIMPGLESDWIDIFGSVALTGEPARFRKVSGNNGKTFRSVSLLSGKGQVCRYRK